MGFFDTYEAPPSGDFVTSDEKTALIESGEPFGIFSVGRRTGQFGPEHVLSVSFENGEDKVLTFGADPEKSPSSRRDMLDQMTEYLKGHPGETIIVRLVESGRSQILEPVTA